LDSSCGSGEPAGVLRFGVNQTNHYHGKIEHMFNLLAENPRMAHERNEISPPVRIYPFHSSHLQKSGWMSGNPTSSPFSRWNEVHGGSMERNSSSEMGRSGEADRRSRLLQVAHSHLIVYTVDDNDDIFIVKIRHGHEDWQSKP